MISVFVPALNEELAIEKTIQTLQEAAEEAGGIELEIIIFNDGSTDRTGEIIDELAKRHSFILPVHKQVNRGPGRNFREAVRLARFDRFMAVPGDNNISKDLLVLLMKNNQRADLVLSYYINMEVRGRFRLILSTLFTTIYLLVFNIFVRYIYGVSVLPTQRLREMKLQLLTRQWISIFGNQKIPFMLLAEDQIIQSELSNFLIKAFNRLVLLELPGS